MKQDIKKKKVGILTLHFALNVGAMLQAYGLQKFLKNYCDCEEVDYRPQYQLDEDDFRKRNPTLVPINAAKQGFKTPGNFFKKTLKATYRFVRAVFSTTYAKEKKRIRRYSRFLKNLKLSKRYSKFEEVADNLPYDLLIVGSDQMWNKEICFFDPVYFLDFPKFNKKKASYAVSAGNTIDDKDIPFVKEKIKNYSFLSVREKTLCEQLRAEGLNCRKDIDPTFLIGMEEYRKLEKKVDIREPYIFVYSFLDSEKLQTVLRELQKKLGYKIIIANNYKSHFKSREELDIEEDCYFGPAEFLYYVDHAEVVVTSSFHGTAFSIIFRKNFVFVPGFFQDRIVTLLETCNLQDRIYKGGDVDFSVDYLKAEQNIAETIKDSQDFLIKMIEEI